jgi:hypothetical protein
LKNPSPKLKTVSALGRARAGTFCWLRDFDEPAGI